MSQESETETVLIHENLKKRKEKRIMKTVFVNGSPHVNVNTARASEEVASARRAVDALAREPWQMTNFVR